MVGSRIALGRSEEQTLAVDLDVDEVLAALLRHSAVRARPRGNTASDLKNLGVSLVGHRRKLLAAIAALRSRVDLTPLAVAAPSDAERRAADGDVLRSDRLDGIRRAA